jgi:hypothetical protein
MSRKVQHASEARMRFVCDITKGSVMGVSELAAKQTITEALYRYCRSLDRMDEDLYATVFEPAAVLEYGEYFTGSPEEFRTWVWTAHEGMQAHSHQIANILIEIAPDSYQAVSEAYVTVCLRTKPNERGDVVDVVERARYLDRWTRTANGEWRISARRLVTDINQLIDATVSPPVTVCRDRADPSFDLFDSL